MVKGKKKIVEKDKESKEEIDHKTHKNITETFKRVKGPKRTGTTRKTKKLEESEEKLKPKDAFVSDLDLEWMNSILKAFDLNCDYGPIIGISRTDRLKRAEYFDLKVDEDVNQILKDEALLEKYPELNFNIWHNIENIL